MLWKIKYTINKIDYLLSQVLLSVQSKFSKVVYEKLRYINKSSKFPLLRGNLRLHPDDLNTIEKLLENPENSRVRGGKSTDITRVIDLVGYKRIENAILTEMADYIREHFGNNYKMNLVAVRNYTVPDDLFRRESI